MRILAAVLFLPLMGCYEDETISAYGAGDKVWVLSELDSKEFTARATLTFPEQGKIAGEAPCNTYAGSMIVPYPWFEATQILSTRMACPDLDAETAFFSALSEMTLSEVLGDVLLLSNDNGRQMVFKADG